MNRRTLGLLAGSSMLALRTGKVVAQSVPASALGAGLTPLGSEAAGNADGSIPAWTGGLTAVPAGWTPDKVMPDFFADEPPVLMINASNMAQHADRLNEGVMTMMTKYGFSIKVYPTHRTAAAPQWVYDNIATNATTAKLDPAGPQLGFTNAYGGIPFPIPNIADPLVAGAQIMWNNNAKWWGYAYSYKSTGYVVNDGGRPVLSQESLDTYAFPYYNKNGSVDTFNGIQFIVLANPYYGPPAIVGEEVLVKYSTDPHTHPNNTWELLNGQGRVRRAPEVAFDTPDSFADGTANYDESTGFTGSLEKYDWKYLGKKEMYIPYNNNGLVLLKAEDVHLAHYLDPNAVRWELHRCWVVEGTLHQGERNVMARRRYYVDEDTWIVATGDLFDASNTLYHSAQLFFLARPDLPGTIFINNVVYNLQTDDYATLSGCWEEAANPTVKFYDSLPDSMFNPQNMAAAAQY